MTTHTHNSYHDTISSAYWYFYTEGASPAGIYANLLIETEWYDQYMSYDNIRARFDSVYNPSQSVKPLQADSVKCEDWKLNWSDYSGLYDYGYIPGLFEFDSSYTFHVYGSSGFPDMYNSVIFPSCTPAITSPAYPDTVGFSGFDVDWDNSCAGQVVLTIMDGEDYTATKKMILLK